MATTPRKWILVVDDDLRLREAWLTALERAGYAAVGSEDGLAAAELIRDLIPDLIVVDLRMPRMSGRDFLELVATHPLTKRIPVLIVSGYLHEEPAVAAEGLNIVGWIAKPVTIPDLLGRIQSVVGPPQPAPPRAGRHSQVGHDDRR